MTATALAASIRPLWTLLKEYGHDPEPLFRNSGIDPELVNDPYARLPVSAVYATWVRASSRIGDPCFGVQAGSHWHPSMFGALGYAWLASDSLRTALERLARYTDLVVEHGAVELSDDREGLTVTLGYEGRPFTLPTLADAQLSILLRLCRLNFGEDLNPAQVTLFHSTPEDPGPFYAYFRCPVVFDTPSDSLTLATEVVDQALPSGNPNLAQINDQEIIRYLAQLDRDQIAQRVKAEIIEQLPSGGILDATVAARLSLGERTLQRRLKDEGTTFKKLLDEVRCELAEAYVRDERWSLTQISYLLGFSEPSAFTRAFRRWTGESPSEYRSTT
jgi:AraC-like DNA-binding protein